VSRTLLQKVPRYQPSSSPNFGPYGESSRYTIFPPLLVQLAEAAAGAVRVVIVKVGCSVFVLTVVVVKVYLVLVLVGVGAVTVTCDRVVLPLKSVLVVRNVDVVVASEVIIIVVAAAVEIEVVVLNLEVSLSVIVVVATSSPLFSSCPFSSSQERRSATKACFSSSLPSASNAARRMRGLGVGSGIVVICRAAAVTRVGVTVAFLSF